MDMNASLPKTHMYEYKEITGKNTKVAFLTDCYENFGWEIDERFSEKEVMQGSIPGKGPLLQEKIVLKRSRKILNKTELTRLQRNFESCLAEIAAMEQSKTSFAQIISLTVGIIGTAFIAGSVFAVTAVSPMWILGSILAIPGFIGWILPIYLFRKIKRQKTKKLTPLIEVKYDEIDRICEKASKLLYHY